MGEETTIPSAARFPDGAALLKRNKLIFYGLALVLLLPYLFEHYSPVGLGLCAVLLILALIVTVARSDPREPAVCGLPVLAVFGALVMLALSYEALLGQYIADSSAVMSRLRDTPCAWLLLAGAALCLLPVKGRLGFWVKAAGWAGLGSFCVLLAWGSRSSYLPASFAFLLMCMVGWYCMCALCYLQGFGTLERNRWLTRLLLAIFAALALFAPAPLQEHFVRVDAWLHSPAGDVLAWWKVLLAVGVLAGCAVSTYDFARGRAGIDCLTLGGLSGLLLLVRVFVSSPSLLGLLTPAVYLAGLFCCIKSDLKNEKTLSLPGPLYLLAQTAVLILATGLLYVDFWQIVLIVSVYGLMFYVLRGKADASARLPSWLLRLSFPAVLAMELLWRLQVQGEAYLFILAGYVVSALVTAVLLWPNPTARTCPAKYCWMVCGFLTVLCLLSVLRLGVH